MVRRESQSVRLWSLLWRARHSFLRLSHLGSPFSPQHDHTLSPQHDDALSPCTTMPSVPSTTMPSCPPTCRCPQAPTRPCPHHNALIPILSFLASRHRIICMPSPVLWRFPHLHCTVSPPSGDVHIISPCRSLTLWICCCGITCGMPCRRREWKKSTALVPSQTMSRSGMTK